MEYLKKDSAKANHLRTAFEAALDRNEKLETVYTNPSVHKYNAWLGVVRSSRSVNGSFPVIISHNTYAFTAGFCFLDPETEALNVTIITPNHKYTFEW